MFEKTTLEALWTDLQGKYGNEADWEDIVRATHLAVARSDAGVDMGSLDQRVLEAVRAQLGS